MGRKLEVELKVYYNNGLFTGMSHLFVESVYGT